MKEEPQVTLPVIHLNGSGAKNLYREYHEARKAVGKAMDLMVEATCHPRDFYPVEGSWERARQERSEMLGKLSQVYNYLTQWEEHSYGHCQDKSKL